MTHPTEPADSVRINKYVALQLGIGRREADQLVTAGHVLINNQPAQLGARVVPQTDTITVSGKQLLPQAPLQYIMLHKPVGYVCSRRQQGDTPTIFSLLPTELQQLKPVGRLDKDTSGLLLLTNDGDFAHRMTHPGFRKQKVYELTLDKPLAPLHQQIIADHGVVLPDGPSRLGLQRLHDGDDTQWQVTMHEGRNRQIRRTFAALGYEVVRLHRTHFGPYALDGLASGAIQAVEVV